MYLYLDTANADTLAIAVVSPAGRVATQLSNPARFRQMEELLPLVDQALKKNRLKLSDLTGVAVRQGPGGFTSLRIGVTTANVLAYALKLPILGLKLQDGYDLAAMLRVLPQLMKKAKKELVIKPIYNRPPNITQSKNR